MHQHLTSCVYAAEIFLHCPLVSCMSVLVCCIGCELTDSFLIHPCMLTLRVALFQLYAMPWFNSALFKLWLVSDYQHQILSTPGSTGLLSQPVCYAAHYFLQQMHAPADNLVCLLLFAQLQHIVLQLMLQVSVHFVFIGLIAK